LGWVPHNDARLTRGDVLGGGTEDLGGLVFAGAGDADFLVGIAGLLSYGVASTFIRYVQTYIPYV
jgi:hypothetical protein